MTRAYLSSTVSDLQECRAAVQRALAGLSVRFGPAEDSAAGEARPLSASLDSVAACDVFIGVVAWRYGFVPAGETKSIVELEYQEARRLGIPRLLFLLSEDAPWPRTMMDIGRSAATIEGFRAELAANEVVTYFADATDLQRAVAAAVAALADPGRVDPVVPEFGEAQRRRYLDRLIQQYGTLDLGALTPSGSAEHPRIGLTSAFVEPYVRADPPPTELPREWLERLRSGDRLDPAGVPDPVDPAESISLGQSYLARPLQPVLDVLTAPGARATVVLGDPGSGKSTMVRYLALSLAGAEGGRPTHELADHLPIVIELRAYAAHEDAGNCTSFEDYLGHRSRTDGLEGDGLEPYLRSGGRALVLFDGLDEISDERRRASLAEQIIEFRDRYRTVRTVVTSRILGYSQRPLTDAGFAHYTLQELDADQIDEFLSRWYAGPSDPAVRQRLIDAVRRSSSLRELAANPLLLTVLALVGRQRELPRGRWALYDHAAHVLLESRDDRRHPGGADQPGFIDVRVKKELLGRLAFRMQSPPRTLAANHIGHDELAKVFEGYLGDTYEMHPAEAQRVALALIGQFRERNFILGRYGPDDYGFVHRTFLEFFCAGALVARFWPDQLWRTPSLRQIFFEHWADPSWHEVLRLIAGTLSESDTASLIQMLVGEINPVWPADDFPQPPWNLALAVQCLGESGTPLGRLLAPAEALLDKIILLLEHSVGRQDPHVASLVGDHIIPAARAIGTSWPGRRRYLDWYRRRGVRLVWAPTMSLAARLAAILAAPDDHLERVFDEELAGIADNRAAAAAVAGLAELAGSRPADSPAWSLLVRRVVEDRHAGVRLAAVQALAERFANEDGPAEVLLDRALLDASAGVRQAAVRAIADRCAPTAEVRAALADRAITDPAATVRRDAVRALAVRFDADDELGQTLERLLSTDGDTEVVAIAARALLDRFSAGDSVRDVVMWRAEDPKSAVRRAATGLLAERWPDDAGAIDVLQRSIAIEEDAAALREAAQRFAARPLEEHRPAALSVLIQRLSWDPNEDIRLAVVQVLADRFPDDPAVRASVLACAEADKDADVRLAAVTALARWAPDEDGLLGALERCAVNDRNVAVRSLALAGLATANWAEADARKLLSQVARWDPEAQVRGQAIAALAGRHGGNAAVQRLIAERCRDDNSREVRLVAVRELTRLGEMNELVRETLIDRVRNEPSAEVFVPAAEAVAHWLGAGPPGRTILSGRASQDFNAQVRRAASTMLAGLYPDDPDVRRTLAGIVRTDLDAEVVGAAATALADVDDADAADRAADLIRRATGDDPAVRRTALRVLGDRYASAPSTLDTLLWAAGSDEDRLVRRAALSLLGRHFADRDGVRAALTAGVREPDWSVREAAVRLLGERFGTDPGIRRLLVDLARNRDDAQLRMVAGQTLSWLPGADPDQMPDLPWSG